MTNFTHFNADGAAHMVDVGDKSTSHRVAVASGRISMQAGTLQMILQGGHKKGDVLGIARVAGIMACKKTADLVPLCHPLQLTHVSVELDPDGDRGIACHVRVECRGQTGVEMEALTGVQIALLTIYDMCKSIDRGMVMTDIQLQSKSGGKSGDWERT